MSTIGKLSAMRRTTRGCRLFITGVLGAALSLGFMPLGVATASIGNRAPQVVGGAPINSSAVPWQVLFIIGNSPDKSELCSGSLISATTVVSAAHCFAGISPGAVQG